MNQKIAIGKFGRVISFNPSKWGCRGGDNEPPIFYENLFHKNPNIDFYIVGLSDFSKLPNSDKLRINKYGNVHDIWSEKTKWLKANKVVNDQYINIKYIEYLLDNNLIDHIDCGLFFFGPMSGSNVTGKTTLAKSSNVLASPLLMTSLYSAPMIVFVNRTNIKYIGLSNDPRYFPTRARDLFIPPTVVLQQYDDTVTFKNRISYTDTAKVIRQVQCKYSALETITFIDNNKQFPTNLDQFFTTEETKSHEKDLHFILACNEKLPYSRLDVYKSFVLDSITNVEIYGKWSDAVINNDSRFKGPKPFNELQQLLKRAKYTFCIPPKKGWVTLKFWEMVNASVIPFMHPDYDTQGHIGFPDFLYVQNSIELKEKIQYLEDHPDDYNKLLNNLKSLIRPEFKSGEYLNSIVMNEIKQLMTTGGNEE